MKRIARFLSFVSIVPFDSSNLAPMRWFGTCVGKCYLDLARFGEKSGVALAGQGLAYGKNPQPVKVAGRWRRRRKDASFYP